MLYICGHNVSEELEMVMKNNVFVTLFMCLALLSSSCSREDHPGPDNPSDLPRSLTARIDSAILKTLAATNAPGVIAGVWIEGEGSYVTAAGVANIATNEQMEKNMHFRIGSVTKTFTGLCVLTLADDSLINLDTPISVYLPEKNIPRGDEITVRMLGNMTSGLFNYSYDSAFSAQFTSDLAKHWDPDTLISFAFTHPNLFDPGTQFFYANTNTVILGLLIEKITGKPVWEVFQERIFGPLKLKNTSWPQGLFLPIPYSHGYSRQTPDGQVGDATYYNPSWCFTAGQLISDVCDLNTHIQAIVRGTLLSPAMHQEQQQWFPLPDDEAYGFGLGYVKGWLGHTGEVPGYNTAMYHLASQKVTIVVHVNSDIAGSDGKNPAPKFWRAIAAVVTPDHIP